MELKEKIDLPEVVFVAGVSWKKVPGYVNTYAGKNGEIGLLNSKGYLIRPAIVEWKTTVGSYLYTKVINDDFNVVQKAIHQLVCLAYHGEAPNDGRIYEPNHKNLNKHDNRPDNLEWITRRENVQHAYDTGNVTTGLRVSVKSVVTGEVKTYFTLSKLSREWCLPRYKMRQLISEHRDIPYQGEWIFSLDDSNDKKINRHQRQPVVYKDYVSGKITVAVDAETAASQTGVKAGTIIFRINPNRGTKSENKLLSRYVFQKLNGHTVWPEYSLEEAQASERKYKENKVQSKGTLIF